ncbi:flagellar biosynthetic protein FliO [Sedimentibacter sp. B4]|uniref:flagellar biosynthetic protein FliO n=1 Tax=Sedimentibacter sp. B4 TaxID=304766 RepID=UPI0012FCFDF7|nr:flagellar biosynthetic protein FliO [Sedimentibacter sp. B4]
MAGIILVLFLTYYGTRWISTKTNIASGSKYMNIVDRIVIGQNKYLVIAEITNKYYLLSITEKDVNIIKELDDFQLKHEEEKPEVMDFSSIINKFLKK